MKGSRTAEKVDAMDNTNMIEEMKKDLLDYFENNKEEFNQVIEELDSYNGYLGDDRYYEMEMLDEFYHGVDATEILARAFYGYDADNWHMDGETKVYGAFNPNRDYFKYNAYGNLVSTDYKDYSWWLDMDFIEDLLDNAGSLYLPEDVTDMIEAIEVVNA